MMKLLGLPPLGSEHGVQVDNLILYVHWLMVALFVGWLAYFLFALFRFREKRNPKASYVGVTNHASNYIEAIVIVAEGVLLLGFAIPLWSGAVDKFPDAKDSVVVRVIGRQFNWLTRYPGPDGVFGRQDVRLVSSSNPMGMLALNEATKAQDPGGADDIILENSEVVVPVNRPVIAHITSFDVIHSFKVIPLRVCQDAIPGMSIPVHFKATETNTTFITCAQLCGQGHYSMKGEFRVLTQQDYDAWLATKKAPTGTPVSYE
jgi:cytochrome c oxidase subunit 2